MWIESSDEGKIYNAAYVTAIEVVPASSLGMFNVQAVLSREAHTDEDGRVAILATVKDHNEGCELARIVAQGVGKVARIVRAEDGVSEE